MYDDLTIQIKT